MFARKYLKVMVMMVIIFLVSLSVCMAEDVTYNYRIVTTIDKANLRDAERNGRVVDDLPAGTPIQVISQGKFFSQIEYEGCVLYVYNELIEPLDENYVVPTPTKAPEKTYTLEGTTPYRVKLSVSTWINVRRQKLDDGGSSGEIYRGDVVYVKSIDSEGWATIIWNSKARYLRINLLEPVTDDMEVLETPLGEYTICNPKKDGSKTVYVRKEPSVKSDIRRSHKVGTTVVVTEDLGAWAHISDQAGKDLGYIMTYFLEPAN